MKKVTCYLFDLFLFLLGTYLGTYVLICVHISRDHPKSIKIMIKLRLASKATWVTIPWENSIYEMIGGI